MSAPSRTRSGMPLLQAAFLLGLAGLLAFTATAVDCPTCRPRTMSIVSSDLRLAPHRELLREYYTLRIDCDRCGNSRAVTIYKKLFWRP